MLYSEIKERENRFIIALKIAFPLLLLIAIFFYAFRLFPDLLYSFFLLILLIPIYVYYAVYLIYHSFQTTLVDPITKTFTRKAMFNKIKRIKNRENTTIIFLHVNNLSDIHERYGINNGDMILSHFIQKLEVFFKNNQLKQVPIGRYSENSFIVFIENSPSNIKHLMRLFTKNIQNIGIHNIEVKVTFSLLNATYDEDTDNIIEHLLMMVEEQNQRDKTTSHVKLNQFESIVNEMLYENHLSFKYQPSLHLHSNMIQIFEVLVRMDSPTYGTLLKQQIQRIVNHMGYEKRFDENVFKLLVEEVQPLIDKECFISVEVSATTLRNISFKRYLTTLFNKYHLDPHRFILEITEQKSYEELHRFKEIIESYQEVGFQIALGNFGGNNCGFEYLKSLPIDLVKFDIEFTKKIDNEKYQQLLKHYIELLQTLKIQTMVKFVDKEILFEKIKEFKPDFIQGFCISKPKKIGELDEIR